MNVELLFPSSDRTLDVVVYILVNLAAKTVLILAILFAVAALFQRLPATGRHLIWTAALSLLVLLPALSFILPSWNLGLISQPVVTGNRAQIREVPPAPIAPSTTSVIVQSPLAPEPAARPNAAPEPEIPAPVVVVPPADPATSSETAIVLHQADASVQVVTHPKSSVASVVFDSGAWKNRVNLPLWIILIWAAGVLVVCFRLLLGFVGIRYLYQKAKCVSDPDWVNTLEDVRTSLDVRRPVSLFECRNLQIPVTWGILRPVILIPGNTSEWPSELRNSVIAHEMAHIKRWDCLTQSIAQIACALYWFNPMVWMATKRMRLEREMACDDVVLEHGNTTASRYAQHLLDLARNIPRSLLSPAVAVAMAHPSHLEGRILSILDDTRKRWMGDRKPVTVSVMAVLLAIAPISAVDLWEGPLLENRKTNGTEEIQAGRKSTAILGATSSITADGPANPAQPEPVSVVDSATDPLRIPIVSMDLSSLGRLIPDSGVLASITRGIVAQPAVDLTKMDLGGPDTTDIDEMIQARIFGIDAEYVRQFKTIGFDDLSMDDLVAFKIHNVTPTNVKALRSLGFEPSPDDVVQATMFNVNEAFVKEMSSFGYNDLDLDDLVQLRIFNVDADFIRKIERRYGHQLSVEKLVQARIFGLESDENEENASDWDNDTP